MANDNNINLNSDGQKQIDNYRKAFNSLKDSLNGLSQPLISLSGSLNSLNKDLDKYTDALSNLNSQNKDLLLAADKADNKLTDLSISFTTWNIIIKLVTETLKGWQIALTGGLSIVTAFLPEIIHFTKALFNGKDALNAMVINFKNLNDIMKVANKDAAAEITRLKILYQSATDINNSYDERIKGVRELKNEYPAHLKGISDENILNGSSKKNYEELTQSIFRNARAKAALNKMTIEANKSLDADFQIQKIKNANFNEKKRYEKEAEEGGNAKRALSYYKEQSDKRASIAIAEQEGIKKATINSIKYLEKLTGGAHNIAKAIIGDDVDQVRNKSTARTEYEPLAPKSTPKPSPALQPTRGTEALTAQSVTIAKTFELQKQQYDADAALLKQQLGQKLISQEAYNQQSSQLQEKYHQDTGDRIKAFAADEMAGTLKNIREAANTEAQRQQAITEVAMQYEQQRRDFTLQTTQQVADSAFSIISSNISAQSDAHLRGLEGQKANELNNTSLTAIQRKAIEDKYKKKEAEEKVKAFKAEQRASVLQAVVNGALAITKATAQTGVFAAFVIPGIIASTALQVATIIAQKPPAFARGGRFTSDGRGALLPGYSRTDDTNARLRSGEAVVVSEAMRNPWARNLVSAINVAHGGRDFSAPATGRGYAIGGIFTDGGNANRYYNQPVNDARDLANTMAYQLINNFPPIYVDVKDVNNQQHILAQTVNRVNL